MARKVVSVVGATGVQGRSVIDALLKDKEYSVRAITRNTQSEKAKALASQGVEVVQADLNDVDSLIKAFKGSSAIYGATDFFEPFAKHGPAKAVEIEIAQGTNLAKAAAATESLEHYIWSTLPDSRRISSGKYVIPHFDGKNVIDRYIKSDSALVAKTTFLWITFYAANLQFPMYSPYWIPTAGKYIQIQPTPPDTPIKSIGDTTVNVGIFVKAILAQPDKTLGGRFVLASVEDTTAGNYLQTWAKAQGKAAQYVQTDEKTFNAIWPMWAEEMGGMMQFWDWAREKSWSGEDVLTKEDLNISEGLVGLEQALASVTF